MEDFKLFLDWLSVQPYPYVQIICTFLSAVFGLIIMVVQIRKYFLYKNQSKDGEVLKYRDESYRTSKTYVSNAQTFKRIVPTYELDDKTNSLVVVSTKDLQELVQSSRDCGLDVVLEKYGVLPTSVPPAVSSKTDVPFDASDVRDDFEYLSETMSEFEELRIRYSMPDATPEQLLTHVNGLKSNIDKSIQDSLLSQKKVGDDNG